MNRGDVVELDWPFSDRKGSKTRPAVVVQADFLNGLIDDTIFVQIGYLSDAAMRQIEECLKTVMEIR
jgi:mRNA-degrading endonuclease toxin of MazEF toxin-antitoxin module